MIIYKTSKGILVKNGNEHFLINDEWDELVNNDEVYTYLKDAISKSKAIANGAAILQESLLPPIGHQEVWASGVTYYKSREARMEESKDAGGGDFYDRVYHAERPELFFKSPGYRVVGHNESVRIRKDSKWNVPEPELTLVITSTGKIIGYTIGNDMSSRDIEGENPLYLPQAKCYDGSTAIGPGIYIADKPIPLDTIISIEIIRVDKQVFQGETTVDQIKRTFEELVEYLYREMSYPYGCLLMTGTGVVPPDSFTLQLEDIVNITIDPIGTLSNIVKTNQG